MRRLLDRLPSTPPALMRRLAIAAVVAQAGISVTGSVVRVTGSGLGCPTWPECFPGSMLPVAHPEIAALRQWVEFSNRLLTFVVVFVAGACLLAALATRPRRSRLTRLALVQPLGVVAQALIGGVTVLTGLAWWTVAVHFLVSMVLVWLAVQLVEAASDGAAARVEVPSNGTAPRIEGATNDDAAAQRIGTWPDGAGPRLVVPRATRALVAASTGLLAAVLLAGTLITAAGPHAGDSTTPRLLLGVEPTAQLHADLLFGYLGMLVALGFTLHAVQAPARVRRRYAVLVAVVLAQGMLGGIQYTLGVPEMLVALHVLGAASVTVAAASLWAAVTPTPTRRSAIEPRNPRLAVSDRS